MRFGFKIHVDDIAEKLKEKGFTSMDLDSDDLRNALLEILSDEYDLLNAIGEQLEALEDKESMPRSKAEYDESIGEF